MHSRVVMVSLLILPFAIACVKNRDKRVDQVAPQYREAAGRTAGPVWPRLLLGDLWEQLHFSYLSFMCIFSVTS